jgi:hypothetical protein
MTVKHYQVSGSIKENSTEAISAKYYKSGFYFRFAQMEYFAFDYL